jgi:AcrR family transcriptional regulator
MADLINHLTPEEVEVAEPGRRERRRAETQQRIMSAAMEMFSTRGYAETTVEDITEAADVGKGTFFNYFPTKDALLLAIFDSVRQRFVELEAQAADVKDVRAVMRDFAHRLLSSMVRSPKMIRNVFGLALTDPVMGERFQNVFAQARQAIVALLDHGQKIGQVRTDLPAAVLGRTFQQFIFGTEILWSFTTGEDLLEWVDVVMEIFWTGSGSPGTTKKGTKAGGTSNSTRRVL